MLPISFITEIVIVSALLQRRHHNITHLRPISRVVTNIFAKRVRKILITAFNFCRYCVTDAVQGTGIQPFLLTTWIRDNFSGSRSQLHKIIKV
jgi:hypothetical protein